MDFLVDLIWAVVGLLLTIGGTLLEASILGPNWGSSWGGAQGAIQVHSLGVTLQVGAVLLVACSAGKNAGALSQIAYLVLGLLGMPIFAKEGGVDYIHQPTFGYLLGFVPGAWLCGWLAFRFPPRLEYLAWSCGVGLMAIHGLGLVYLLGATALGWVSPMPSLLGAIARYTVYPLPGQVAIACASTVLALGIRRMLLE